MAEAVYSILISKLTSSPALAAILQSRRQVYVSLSGDIMFYWRCKLRPRRNEIDQAYVYRYVLYCYRRPDVFIYNCRRIEVYSYFSGSRR